MLLEAGTIIFVKGSPVSYMMYGAGLLFCALIKVNYNKQRSEGSEKGPVTAGPVTNGVLMAKDEGKRKQHWTNHIADRRQLISK
jgi:hypothetical protein